MADYPLKKRLKAVTDSAPTALALELAKAEEYEAQRRAADARKLDPSLPADHGLGDMGQDSVTDYLDDFGTLKKKGRRGTGASLEKARAKSALDDLRQRRAGGKAAPRSRGGVGLGMDDDDEMDDDDFSDMSDEGGVTRLSTAAKRRAARSRGRQEEEEEAEAEESVEDAEYDEDPYNVTLPMAHGAQVNRWHLIKWHDALSLEATIVGCLVRVVVGPRQGNDRERVYRLARIVSVSRDGRPYKLQSPNPQDESQVVERESRVKIGVKIGDSVREIPGSILSNTFATQDELDFFLRHSSEGDRPLTKRECVSATRRLHDAEHHVYNDDEIDELVRRNKESGAVVENFADLRSTTATALHVARAQGKVDEAHRLEAELASIDARAREYDARKLHISRTRTSSAVVRINERNRRQNLARQREIAAADAERRRLESEGVSVAQVADPFSRRRTRPDITVATPGSSDAIDEAEAAEEEARAAREEAAARAKAAATASAAEKRAAGAGPGALAGVVVSGAGVDDGASDRLVAAHRAAASSLSLSLSPDADAAALASLSLSGLLNNLGTAGSAFGWEEGRSFVPLSDFA
jgi:hypothetical protein